MIPAFFLHQDALSSGRPASGETSPFYTGGIPESNTPTIHRAPESRFFN
jgi:hypothetical protein